MAVAMGVDTRSMTTPQAADAALAAAARLADDVGIPQSFTTLPAYSKSRVGESGFPTPTEESDVGAIALHALGDVCTMTNPRVMTLDSLGDVVRDCLVGSRS